MAFDLKESESVLLPSVKGSIFDFVENTTINHIRITNTSASKVTISVWFDFDGTSAGDTEKVLSNLDLSGGESVVMDGMYNFLNGGRITAQAGTASVISFHFTRAMFGA